MKRNTFLKIKLKSLADEASIIRLEERKANSRKEYKLQNELVIHRKQIVRREARATVLAYQYLRKISYSVCETSNSDNPIHWSSVKRMIKRYGTKKQFQEFNKDVWMNS